MYSRLLRPPRRAVLRKVLSNLQRRCGTVWRPAKPAVNIQRRGIINPVVGAEIQHRSLVLCHGKRVRGGQVACDDSLAGFGTKDIVKKHK